MSINFNYLNTYSVINTLKVFMKKLCFNIILEQNVNLIILGFWEMHVFIPYDQIVEPLDSKVKSIIFLNATETFFRNSLKIIVFLGQDDYHHRYLNMRLSRPKRIYTRSPFSHSFLLVSAKSYLKNFQEHCVMIPCDDHILKSPLYPA